MFSHIPDNVVQFMELFLLYPKRRKKLLDGNQSVIDWIDDHTDANCQSLAERVHLLLHPSVGVLCPYGKRKRFTKNQYVCMKSCQCVSDKKNKTLLDNHGDNYRQEIMAKSKSTNLEKYGREFPTQSTSVKNKTKATTMERYGVTSYLATKECQDKAKTATIEKYGTPYYLQSQKGQDTNKITLTERYGVTNASMMADHSQKVKLTSRLKFGHDHAMQSQEIKDKQQHIINQKYGVDNPKLIGKDLIKSSEYHDDIKFKEIYEKFDTVIQISDYFGYNTTSVQKRAKELDLAVKYSYTSNGQMQIANFIESLGITVQLNNRSVIHPLELDIYMPHHALAIEFNGTYWHSDQFLDDTYHLNKTQLSEKAGVQLLHVSDIDWCNNSTLIKSMIRHRLGMTDITIPARKCNITPDVSNEEVRTFLNDNHIQGHVNSSLSIGLTYQSELLAVMTFAASRFDKNQPWELMRYCTKAGHSVVGGASKMFKYFLNNTHGNCISYAARSYSQGNLYNRLGFEFHGNTAPNYKYLVNGILESRMKYQKHKLKAQLLDFDQSLTERQNMTLHGHRRIYDSGNQKWIYNRR